jgi:hypothetical protein
VIERHKKKSSPTSVTPHQLGSFQQIVAGEDATVAVFRFDRVTTNFVIPRGFQIDGVTPASKGGWTVRHRTYCKHTY